MKNLKVVVTGAAGKFGTVVCKQLRADGTEFLAIDKEAKTDLYDIEVVDLLDAKATQRALKGADAVVHLGNHTDWHDASPQVVFNENVSMNMNVFQAAADKGLKRIIFASSIQAISGELPVMKRENQTLVVPSFPMDSDMPLHPRNPYALSKVLSERMLDYFSETFEMTCVSIRYPWLISVDGMSEAKKWVEGSENVYDGFAYLDFESAADLICRCLSADLSGHRSYFPASKDPLNEMTVNEVATQFMDGLELRKNLNEMDTLVDCSMIEREIGWRQP